jgi:hypothetical protein
VPNGRELRSAFVVVANREDVSRADLVVRVFGNGAAFLGERGTARLRRAGRGASA